MDERLLQYLKKIHSPAVFGFIAQRPVE